MSQTLVAFAAKGIQDYIFSSNRLKEIVGGSELVDQLCTSFLDDCLVKLGLDSQCKSLVQAAGWGRLVFDSKEAADRFMKVWPLLAGHFAPGLQLVQAAALVGDDLGGALKNAGLQLEQQRSCPVAVLPEIGPLVERAPRTGEAAVTWLRDKKDAGRQEPCDAASLRKLEVRKSDGDLIGKIDPAQTLSRDVWTDDINQLAELGEKGYIAVLHADGNGLGQLVMGLGGHDGTPSSQDAGEKYQAFSQLIDEVNQEAAQQAFTEVLKPDWEAKENINNGKNPALGARPVVLGGDDLTIILRADLAIGFAKVYLETFEALSEQKLAAFNQTFGLQLTTRLTACAGIAFAKPNYPFSSAVELAEELCGAAKSAGRILGQPSSLMFHRISSSVCDSFEVLKQRELTGHDGLELTMGPYRLGRVEAPLPDLKSLEELVTAVAGLARGPIRQLLATLAIDRCAAGLAFDRILQVFEKRRKGSSGPLLMALETLKTAPKRPFNEIATPLPDAYLLREMGHQPQRGEPE